jgi:sirohydrochlorin cobaltochelatase
MFSLSLSYINGRDVRVCWCGAMTRALLVVGHGSRERAGTDEFLRFVSSLAPRWPERLVRACFLELTDPPLIPTLGALIADGVTDITVGPAFLLAAGHIKNDVPAALDIARAQHAGVTIRYAAPLGVEPRLVRALQDRIQAVTVDVPQDDTIVLLIGRGTSDPDANADVYKLGRLLWEGRAGKGVEVAFTSLTHPTIPEGIARCVALGARHVVVAPSFSSLVSSSGVSMLMSKRKRHITRTSHSRWRSISAAIHSSRTSSLTGSVKRKLEQST